MRILNFKVNGQNLEPDDDFSDLVPGTSGYMYANFEFSKDWSDCIKIATFYDRKGTEHAVLISNGKCEIPEEVLVEKRFRMSVFGKKQDYKIVTKTIKVIQGGG